MSVQVQPVMLAEDRSMAIPPNHVVRTAYIDVWQVKMACRERMSFGDIKNAYEKRLQLGSDNPWPCPRGEWEGEEGNSRFIIIDGRHEYLATLALGHQYILVAWVVPQ